jgi:hypothetical protein
MIRFFAKALCLTAAVWTIDRLLRAPEIRLVVILKPEAPVKGGDKMAVTATPSSSRLVLDYGEDGSYSVTKLNPAAADEDLHKMAQSVAAFQEGTPADVINYVETMLEKG